MCIGFATVLFVVAYITANDIEQLVGKLIENAARRAGKFSERLENRLGERSVPCMCPRGEFEIFEDDKEIIKATEIRFRWTRDLEISLRKEMDRSGNPREKKRGDLEIPYGHRRFDLLGPVAPKCRQLESFGQGDDEKRACGLKQLLERKPGNCTIVSLGSNNQWGFEEAIFKEIPRCMIHTFDCTVKTSVRPPASIASRTTLHRICIGAADETTAGGLPFLSWGSVMQLIGATEPPLYLKMDIEGYEYEVRPLGAIISLAFDSASGYAGAPVETKPFHT